LHYEHYEVTSSSYLFHHSGEEMMLCFFKVEYHKNPPEQNQAGFLLAGVLFR